MNYEQILEKVRSGNAKICILGIGYVGLPLLIAFSNAGHKILGFDVDKEKIEGLAEGKDITNEYNESKIREALKKGTEFTSDETKIKECDFIIMCVPTPVREDKEPEMKYVKSASEIAGKNLKEGAIVVLESTVYPGTTEEVIVPILEEQSEMKCGKSFSVGYSPERINVGDDEHSLEKIVKIVSGFNEETARILEQLYKRIIKAGVHKAPNLKTAEAAKSIENIQRDINIALVNELSLIFEKMGVDIVDVLEAAGTKWNFHHYTPGLVGGHCIPEDPYFLVHKAKKVGYNPKMILAGREINNFMSQHTVDLMREGLEKNGKKLSSSKILLMGLTFKKNVRDIRNTPVKEIISYLKEENASVMGFDPMVIKEKAEKMFGIPVTKDISKIENIDCIALLSDHDIFKNISFSDLKKICNEKPVIIDVRRFYKHEEAKKEGFVYLGFGYR